MCLLWLAQSIFRILEHRIPANIVQILQFIWFGVEEFLREFAALDEEMLAPRNIFATFGDSQEGGAVHIPLSAFWVPSNVNLRVRIQSVSYSYEDNEKARKVSRKFEEQRSVSQNLLI